MTISDRALGDHCIASSTVKGVSYGPITAANPGTYEAATPAPAFNGTMLGGIQVSGTATLQTSFLAEFWVASGPGPIYTDEFRLVNLVGAQPMGTLVEATRAAGNLPVAGRPFDATRDAFKFVWNNGFTIGSGQTLTLSFQCCSPSASVTDCCAELNSKLDELLAFVAKVYRNQA